MPTHPPKSKNKASVHDLHRAWAAELVRMTGLPPSRVATGAGLSDTTLSRLVNDESYDGTLSPLTIARLVETYEVPSPDHFVIGSRLVPPAGDALLLAARDHELDAMVETLAKKSDTVERYQLQRRSLDALGYMVGDIVFVDTARMPQPGDIVLAQWNERADREPEKIFRLYEPPYLITASLAPASRRPLLVDGERIVVIGVVIGSARVGRREN